MEMYSFASVKEKLLVEGESNCSYKLDVEGETVIFVRHMNFICIQVDRLVGYVTVDIQSFVDEVAFKYSEEEQIASIIAMLQTAVRTYGVKKADSGEVQSKCE